PGHVGHVRGHPGDAAPRALVGHRRPLRGDHPLHRADGDPDLHEVGRGRAGEGRPVLAAAARQRRRADQPRGMALVPGARRRRQGADRRHVVADRDGDDHDHPNARRHDDQARQRDVPVPRRRGGRRGRQREERPAGWRRLPRPEAAMARDAPRHLRRPGPVPGDVLEPLRGDVLRRRRREARRGGLLLAARPRRRRDERLRPSPLDHRDRERPRLPRPRRRGRRRRHPRRPDRRSDLRLRDPQAARRTVARVRPNPAPARRRQNRPDRPAESRDVHPGSAQNPLRQDHAPPPARHRRRPRPRRHHHPRRRRRRRGDPGRDERGQGRGV
ncbi:MAG: Acetyl-CoA synthetase, partial [uncultured Thermomicrobiales bacterium]